MQKLLVQPGTENEWQIAYEIIKSNPDSKSLVFMIHGGGMDLHERYFYLTEEIYDATGKRTKTFDDMVQGNYDRLTERLIKNNADCIICRMDNRNHGESLVDGQMDKRNTSFIRLAQDEAELLRYIIQKYKIEHVEIVGTCMGTLITQLMLTNENNRDIVNKVDSVVFNSPLYTQNLAFPKEYETFNYKKYQQLINSDDDFQFTKMRGVFDSKETLLELTKYPDLHKKFAELTIPTQLYLGFGDRLLPYKRAREIAEEIRQINPNCEIIKVSRSPVKTQTANTLIKKIIAKDSNHCLYDPKSSYKFVTKASEFILTNLANLESKNDFH